MRLIYPCRTDYKRICSSCRFIIISCPTEMVMTYQGRTGGSFLKSANQIKENNWKRLFTGLLLQDYVKLCLPLFSLRDHLY